MKNRKVAAWVLVALVGCAASVSLGGHAQGGPAQGGARDDAAGSEVALKKVAPQAERVTQGRIESVTVYRGQALVTRMVDASTNGSAVQEIIVTNLPNRIVPESLHAEGLGGAAVRSVRFRTRPVEQDTREGVRALDEQIEEVAIKIESCKRQIELIAEHRAYLTSLQQFVAPTATTELSKGVLNAQTIEQLSGNLRSQRKEMAEEELKLQSQARMHERSLELLRRQRDELTRGASTTVLEAVVLVARAQDTGSAACKLRYLVNDATWEPSYTLRAAKEGVALEYFASIAQMSGEDWGDVRMTLSTATPSLVASAPVLAPLSLSLAAPTPEQAALAYVDAVRSLEQQRSEVVLQRMQAIKTELGEGVRVGAANEAAGSGRKDLDDKLNRFARDRLVLDLTSGSREAEKGRGAAIATMPATEGLAVTYVIDGQTTLPSRSDRQLVQIARVPVEAKLLKVAAPALTSYVYDQMSSVNTSSLVLLAGPMASYNDGAFVGSGQLGTTASGQSFDAGLGIDSSLRTRRELVDRSESVQGGNRVVTITYRLVVENFSTSASRVRVVDRMPTVQRGVDIKVRLQNTSMPLASQSQRANRESQESAKRELAANRENANDVSETGLLAWDVDVPASATDAAALTLEYTYTMEYDKQMTLVGS